MFLNQKVQTTPSWQPLRYSTRLDNDEEEQKKKRKGNSSVFIVQIPIESVRLRKKRNKRATENFCNPLLHTLPLLIPYSYSSLQLLERTYSSTWCLEFKCCNARAWQAAPCAPQVRQYVATSNYVAHATASSPVCACGGRGKKREREGAQHKDTLHIAAHVPRFEANLLKIDKIFKFILKIIKIRYPTI